MSISLSSSLMAYAKSMEGKSLEGYSRLSPTVFQSKRTKNNATSNNNEM